MRLFQQWLLAGFVETVLRVDVELERFEQGIDLLLGGFGGGGLLGGFLALVGELGGEDALLGVTLQLEQAELLLEGGDLGGGLGVEVRHLLLAGLLGFLLGGGGGGGGGLQRCERGLAVGEGGCLGAGEDLTGLFDAVVAGVDLGDGLLRLRLQIPAEDGGEDVHEIIFHGDLFSWNEDLFGGNRMQFCQGFRFCR